MNAKMQIFIKDMEELLLPKKTYVMDGTQNEAYNLVELAMKSKFDGRFILHELNQTKFPNSYYHRSNPNDVARTEHLTFVCTKSKNFAGLNNNWMHPNLAREKMINLFKGAMQGRTMYVIPFVMGNPDSPYSKNGVQVTDSLYVALSMRIMTRVGNVAIQHIESSNDFFRGIHSVGDVNPNRRFIMHFPESNMVMSFGSGYGGNALLGKKCFSLRIGSYMGLKQNWLAEHMIIIGVQCPNGNILYFLGAFPSACGKTNLALLEPIFKDYKIWTLGDDIAWIHIGSNGKLYAINPEAGFFGVAPGTSIKTNPTMMKTLTNNKFFPTLFTNTAINNIDNTPWWEGMSNIIPQNITDWNGNNVNSNIVSPLAHPNSRFTVSMYNCPTLSKEYNNPHGVPISGIIFGGRRSDTLPLVYEANGWSNGVFLASILGSETTAAASGKIGCVRRDPMAMLPFCGYNMGDYFKHWLNIGKQLQDPPKIFMVNWFRKDQQGNFMWPGYRENFRILKWMIDRIHGNVSAKETAIGLLPIQNTIDTNDLQIDPEVLSKLLLINKDEWRKELMMIEEFYKPFGNTIPNELLTHLNLLKRKLEK
ncbi:MAG: phosphoenolpyruvate carboxykinase (GTP) [Endomicrobium sp.]|nr:phosphoenolpyruvate carboxykinase (GTP) [Endomicrobium sp.]